MLCKAESTSCMLKSLSARCHLVKLMSKLSTEEMDGELFKNARSSADTCANMVKVEIL